MTTTNKDEKFINSMKIYTFMDKDDKYWRKIFNKKPNNKCLDQYDVLVSKDEYNLFNDFENSIDYKIAMRNIVTKQTEDITELNNRIELLYEIMKKQQEEIKQLKKNQEQEYPDFLYG